MNVESAQVALQSPHQRALEDPSRPAQIMASTGRALSYGDLDIGSIRIARLLRDRGLRQGDHIALLTGNHELALTVCWAAQRSGMYWTPLNTRWTADELRHVIVDSGAGALFVNADTARLALEVVWPLEQPPVIYSVDDAVPGVTSLTEAWRTVATQPLEDEAEGTDMLYSSGTTGRPKGVVPGPVGAPFGVVDVTMDSLRRYYGIDQNTVFLAATPLFHIAALASALMTHRVGGTVVVLERFSPTGFLRAVQEYGATHTMVVPTMFGRLLELPVDEREQFDLSTMRFFGHGGAPCPPSVKQAMLDWVGPVVVETWGATERPGLTMIGAREWLGKRGSVGKPFIGRAHILDEALREVPPGTVGEIYWESPHPFVYHNDPVKTAASRDPHGWCSVGDLGYLDADGYLYLTDRASFMIITGGENVYPVEVENVLVEHPAVRDAAVVGRRHEDLGEQVVAFVELRGGQVASDQLRADIAAFARTRLAGYKCPRRVEFISQLPRSATGKLIKRELP